MITYKHFFTINFGTPMLMNQLNFQELLHYYSKVKMIKIMQSLLCRKPIISRNDIKPFICIVKSGFIFLILFLSSCNKNGIEDAVYDISLLCQKDFNNIEMNTPFPIMTKTKNKNNEDNFNLEFRLINGMRTYYEFSVQPKLKNNRSFIMVPIESKSIHFETLPAPTLTISLKWSLSNIEPQRAGEFYQNSIPGIYPVRGESVIIQIPILEEELSMINPQLSHTFIESEKYAIDMAADIGADVIAFKGGKVIWTEDRYGDYGCAKTDFITLGNSVRILHDDGTEARYLHLKQNSLKISVGQRVEAGQLIAQVGNSGPSESPHLHFQIGGIVNESLVSFPVLFKHSSDDIAWRPEYLQKIDQKGVRPSKADNSSG